MDPREAVVSRWTPVVAISLGLAALATGALAYEHGDLAFGILALVAGGMSFALAIGYWRIDG